MPLLLSVTVGAARSEPRTPAGVTAIDKRPVTGPVEVRAPGPNGIGGSGLAGDQIGDKRHHGGTDQAVYAYASEDLAWWSARLGRELPPGSFGENLSTKGLDVTGALIGERWRIGGQVVLEVAVPRIPCQMFADWIDERGWITAFIERGIPGAYLRVIEPGRIQAGDPVTVIHRPDHEVTIGLTFRALTKEPDLLPRLQPADALPADVKERVLRRLPDHP
ncbi:MAG TPA: MOSC domain-containing protein [Mycobacteriales bacterium]|nr:MOSC domain-containing protein [Mycobacteriales bacterium]